MVERATPPTERIQAILDELKRRTARDAYYLELQPEQETTPICSKFGGLPYWDLTKPYPVDSKGEKLFLLAQINFDEAEIDADSPLPQTGMLQFFIAVDEDMMWGANFDEPDVQKDFRVVYHPHIDKTVTAQQIKEQGIPDMPVDDDCFFPILKEVAVKIQKKQAVMGTEDYRFDAIMADIIKDVCKEDLGEREWYSYITDEEEDYICDPNLACGNWMLGYPFFTQGDIREDAGYLQYDTLLLQIDSEDDMDYIMWGDCGVGNFFIPLEHLKKKDFSKVLYNWDCY